METLSIESLQKEVSRLSATLAEREKEFKKINDRYGDMISKESLKIIIDENIAAAEKRGFEAARAGMEYFGGDGWAHPPSFQYEDYTDYQKRKGEKE